jgi:hypothetical protein
MEEYAKAAGEVLIRQLKKKFLVYVISFLPASFAGPLAPVVSYLASWIFDWVSKQTEFLIFCKYTDFRVAHQGTDLGNAILKEIIAKKGGNLDEILKAEMDADIAFDNFVILSR